MNTQFGMAYLVHHTLNPNGIYTGRKPNPYPLMKIVSLINRSAKRTQRLKTQHFSHSTPMEESVILNIQYTGESTVVKW